MSSLISIPASNSTVSVSILNVASVNVPAFPFLHPVPPGHERLVAPVFTFLIEHPNKNRKIMFDLGLRKRLEESAPAFLDNWSQPGGMKADVEKDVATRLKEGGVDLGSVDTIIWSHSHIDHTGDPSTFPSTTELVIGPGTKEAFFPPYPEGPNSPLLASNFEGRKVTELNPEQFTLTIGGFKALDYFGDGSLYLLDTPGHCPGHITGLARVTITPLTFILMGGDTSHHPGQFRPSVHIPCPCSLLSGVSHEHFPHAQTTSDVTKPLLTIPLSELSVYADAPRATESIEKLSAFDAHPDILVLLAHDSSMQDAIRYFPEKANAWKEMGWKEKRWAFLEKGSRAWRFAPA
ncbi:Metallo-hydrolase/oxidoreductase [Neolentinus lepideus HHB14362 ss-1]|uniref:Metallo-hydrolase/oxidoreductase n=1 Tax=Neolentinus lepideus HHB14362 ss-1 TaxID=1314782 RepID=A0A165PGW4_9AGAM|nr:Metallo-hydrolase/oxidoreductase [Neolentinus lepideus HHB14362 ss-1]